MLFDDPPEIEEVGVTVGLAGFVLISFPTLLAFDPDGLRNAATPPAEIVGPERFGECRPHAPVQGKLNPPEIIVHVAKCRTRDGMHLPARRWKGEVDVRPSNSTLPNRAVQIAEDTVDAYPKSLSNLLWTVAGFQKLDDLLWFPHAQALQRAIVA